MFSQIEHYRILREIGGGGFAKVYLAEDEQLRREVAIKVLHANLAENTDFRRFFEREARLVASLEHLAVVPIYDYGEIEGQLFLVMRYMRGGTLADRLEKTGKALPLAEVIALLDRLAPTLDAIHERGVIHRDLKPSNILYDESGSAYIADFGIARMQQATTRYTQTGISFGTPQYSSPEQVTGEGALDHRSDIYTLGVILYQLLTGEYPFWSDTPLGWVHKHAEAPIPNIREVNRALPQGVQSVIEGALAKAREDRYESSKAILDDLKRAVAGEPILFKGKAGKTVAGSRTVKKATRDTPRQPPFALWSAAGAVILVIFALGLLFWQNRQDGQVLTGTVPSPTVFIDGGGTPVQLTISPTTNNNGVATPGSNTPNPPTSTPLATQTQPAPTEVVATPTIDATAQAIAALEQLPPNLQTRTAFFAPYLRGTPNMDGDLSEWDDAFFQELSYVLFRPENVLNSADLAAECAGAWDLEAFYLACRIRDETLVQVSGGERLFQGDGIELLLDERVKPDGAHAELDADDFQIGVLPGGAFGRATEVYRWYPQNKAGTLTSVAVGSQSASDGYTVEMRIPWAELGGTTHVGAVYGFGLNINDNDTPKTTSQESQLSLFEGQQLRNPTTWGLLVLLGEP